MWMIATILDSSNEDLEGHTNGADGQQLWEDSLGKMLKEIPLAGAQISRSRRLPE